MRFSHFKLREKVPAFRFLLPKQLPSPPCDVEQGVCSSVACRCCMFLLIAFTEILRFSSSGKMHLFAKSPCFLLIPLRGLTAAVPVFVPLRSQVWSSCGASARPLVGLSRMDGCTTEESDCHCALSLHSERQAAG